MAYYSLKEINEIGAKYNFLLGGRGVGKTYAVIRQAIEHYFETGEKFAYVRRYKESITPTKVGFLLQPHYGLIERLSRGRYNHVRVFKQCFWLEFIGEDGTVIEKSKEPMGHLVSLNTQDNDKGQDLGYVKYIIFDEVIARNGYLSDEWTIFTNCISSLVRDREGTIIYMLANPISKWCLYFDEMGIDFDNAVQGQIMVIKYDKEGTMKCAFEYIADNNAGSSKVANEYFAFNNAKVKSITQGIWELEEVSHLPSGIYKISEHIRDIYCEFKGKVFCCEILKYNNVYYLFWRPSKKIPEKTYYLTLVRKFDKYAVIGCNKQHPIVIVMNTIFSTGQVYYSTNIVGDYILGFRQSAHELKI